MPGIKKREAILIMCGFRAVLIFIETAMTPVRTAIASTGGMIASVAGKRTVFRTIRSAFTTVDALSIVVTLQGHFAFVGQDINGKIKCPLLGEEESLDREEKIKRKT